MKPAGAPTITLLAALGLAACGAFPGLGPGPSATESGAVPLPPTIEARFEVQTPAHTPDGSAVYLELLDTITGGAFNSATVEMQAIGDGRWAALLAQPHGALVRYHYGLRGPNELPESTLDGQPVNYRVANLNGTTLVRDVVANWGPDPREAPSGRILGQVSDAGSGEPLLEMLVSAGGRLTFTDGEGRFRLEGLPAGEHSMVAFSPDGSFLPAAQGAIVAGGSTTPAELRLSHSSLVQLTFEVELPPGTPQDLPVRMAANIRQFGDLFNPLEGGVQVSAARMPELVRVGPDQAILLAQAYAGTDLRYKFTLGDGLWSSERDSGGAFTLRRMIVPGEETVVRERVAAWLAGGEGLRIRATVPEGTPAGSRLGLQLNPGIWFEPLPMAASGDNRFDFLLTGPLTFQSPLQYRFCLNMDCLTGAAASPEGTPAVHAASPSGDAAVLEHQLDRWAAPQGQSQPATVVAPEITPRAGWELGVELAPIHKPAWALVQNQLLDDIAALSSTHVIHSPVWIVRESAGFPLMEFDPRFARFAPELSEFSRQAADHGLGLILHPRLSPELIEAPDWWQAASRDIAWWDVFFEELRSFLLTQAVIAEAAGIERIVIGGPEFLPALPGATLPDGRSSGVPADAADRWGSILADMRALYSGQLAWEHQAARAGPLPDFVEQVDLLHVNWSLELSQDPQAAMQELQEAAGSHLTQLMEEAGGFDLRIVLSVAYPALEGASAGCSPLRRDCPRLALPTTPGSLGAASQAGLMSQAQAINAVLLGAYETEAVVGFFVRGFNPANPAMDTSTSARGKPAGDVIWYWYQRLNPAAIQGR